MPQDLIANVARAASTPAPEIVVSDELSLAASAIASIAALHVQWFEKCLAQAAAGARGIRPEECEKLRALWSDAGRRIDEGRPLSSEQVAELEEALESGDYDHALAAPELSVVRRWRGYH